MTPSEFESLLYYGKKAFNWLLVAFLAGYILWIAFPRLAILVFIVFGIFVLFVARESWKTHRGARATTGPRDKTKEHRG